MFSRVAALTVEDSQALGKNLDNFRTHKSGPVLWADGSPILLHRDLKPGWCLFFLKAAKLVHWHEQRGGGSHDHNFGDESFFEPWHSGTPISHSKLSFSQYFEKKRSSLCWPQNYDKQTLRRCTSHAYAEIGKSSFLSADCNQPGLFFQCRFPNEESISGFELEDRFWEDMFSGAPEESMAAVVVATVPAVAA